MMHPSDPRADWLQPRRRFNAALLALSLGACTSYSGAQPFRAQSLRPTSRAFEGPYRPPEGTVWGGIDLMTSRDASSPGNPLVLAGRLLDTSGRPQAGLELQVWQANSSGRYDYHPGETPGHGRPDAAFRGYGQSEVDPEGWYAFRTIRPVGYRRTLFGVVPWTFVPHIHVAVRSGGRDLLLTQVDLDEVAARRPALAFADHAALMRSEGMRRLVAATGSAAVAEAGTPAGAELIRFDIVLENTR
jgi:protocatechuate 3,4-dioxygenase beta subunit